MNIPANFLALLAAFALPAHALVISYQYDAAGRLKSANYGGTSNTAYSYDANGNLLARTNTVNQFTTLVGSYTGQITGGTLSATNTGIITLSVASNGAFTGTLTLGATKFKMKGTFDATGASGPIPLTRKAPLAPITLNLQLDLDSGGIVTGTLSGGETSTVLATLSPFGKKAPAPGGAVGTFTGLFFATESVATKPKGTGFGTVKVAATGSVKLAGTLADGTKISQGTTLVSETQWPLFVPLYKGGGLISGLVEYAPEPTVGDFGSVVDWIKPATTTVIYPGAFTTQLNFSAARYTPPAKGQHVLDLPDTSPNGDFLADDGTVDRVFTLDTKNKVTFALPNPEEVKLTLGTKAGTVGGSLLFGGKPRKLKGILQLEQNFGAGFFFTDTESLAFGFGED